MSLEADSRGRLPQGCELRICENQTPISPQVSNSFFFLCRRQKTGWILRWSSAGPPWQTSRPAALKTGLRNLLSLKFHQKVMDWTIQNPDADLILPRTKFHCLWYRSIICLYCVYKVPKILWGSGKHQIYLCINYTCAGCFGCISSPFRDFFSTCEQTSYLLASPICYVARSPRKRFIVPVAFAQCTHCEVYRNPKHFHRDPYGQTRQVLLKVLNYQCDSCFYFLERFTPWLHITYELLEKGPWSHLGSVCFSEDVLMQLSQPFHLQLAPLSTDDQSSKTPERF